MKPPERFPPDDPREWLNRARSNLVRARNRIHGAYLEDLCFDAQQAAGKVLIRRKDGRTYALVPERPATSPLDVPSIQAHVSTREIVTLIRDQRRRIRGRGRRTE